MNTEFVLISLTLIIGFYMAWNIGANDVSNAMGTSVGSKALTLKKAVIYAAILEFLGAYLVGSHVSKTIQTGIIKPEFFNLDPMVFALGMLAALLSVAIWLHLASFFHLPVSATQGIVGAVFGFGLIIGGVHAVYWQSIISIILSWVISPLIGGSISYLIFTFLQKKVLFNLNPLESTKKLTPFLVFFTSIVFFFLIFYKGHIHYLSFSFTKSLLLSIAVGFIAALFSIYHIKKMPSIKKNAFKNIPQHAINLGKAMKYLQRTKLTSSGETYEKTSSLLKELKGLSKEVNKNIEYSQTTAEYAKVEKIFGYLQIKSACLVAFSHGANDVANAIAPVASVFQVVKSHFIPDSFVMPSYFLIFGGVGIVVGLATWGWRVIETIGKKITELTPTRGFSAELATALTILIASKLGLPISTTHVLVGSVLGVGFARGINALNLKTLKDIAISWVITVPLCAVFCIFVFYILKILFKI